jgi:hypothetical protein
MSGTGVAIRPMHWVAADRLESPYSYSYSYYYVRTQETSCMADELVGGKNGGSCIAATNLGV